MYGQSIQRLTKTTTTRFARLGNDTVVGAAPSAALLFNRVGNGVHCGVILGRGKECRDSAESVHDGFVCLWRARKGLKEVATSKTKGELDLGSALAQAAGYFIPQSEPCQYIFLLFFTNKSRKTEFTDSRSSAVPLITHSSKGEGQDRA